MQLPCTLIIFFFLLPAAKQENLNASFKRLTARLMKPDPGPCQGIVLLLGLVRMEKSAAPPVTTASLLAFPRMLAQ